MDSAYYQLFLAVLKQVRKDTIIIIKLNYYKLFAMVEAINIELAALTEFYGVISYLLTFTWKKDYHNAT